MRYLQHHPSEQSMIQAFLGIKVPAKATPAQKRSAAKDFDTAWSEMEREFADVPDIWKS